MKWFYNFKISTKLLTAFILVALIAGMMGIYGMINIKMLDKSDTELYNNFTVPISQMSYISTAFQRMRVNLRDMILANSASEIEDYVNRISQRRAEIIKYTEEFQKTIISKEMQQAYDEFIQARKDYDIQLDIVIELARANRDAEAAQLISDNGDLGIISRAEQDVIAKIIEMKVADSENKAEANTKQASTTMLIMGILIVIAMALSIILGWFISKIISKPLKQAAHMINEMSMGHLGLRLKMYTKDEIGQMAAAMDSFADDLQNMVIATMKKISNGDVSSNITPKDDKDEISPALKQTIETIKDLLTEANMLSKAAVEGKLDTRGNAEKFKGGYKDIVDGVNKTLDSVIGPLNVAAEYVDRISKGDIPTKITESYNGDFNAIKNNLNVCIDAVNALVADANMLSKAAIEGKLETRADASKHGGDFAKIVDGVNKTLDAVIKPVQEAASVLNEMSNGNLQMRVTGNYNGDHAEIKNALNETLDALSAYVDEIANVLTEMANSNMVVEISGDYKGDFAPIKQALNLIIDSFNQVLSDINNAADQVAAGSRQVSDGSQALSQGATEQASSIEQLTASITEIAAQTKQNAVSANEANELALTAKNNAADGNEQMKDMLKAMEEINVSSANIYKIIKVIDEIAFQTNILALNAAVEAARAGQHGKGFAVVAEEVRNLAARSASAAKETTGLIEGSIKKVEIGTRIANETATALDKIVNNVAKAANLVGTIAMASNEQATGIAQVNQGVEQVSMVVQTNSATAEESAAASEELSSQADLLKEMIGRFRLKNGESQSAKSHPLESVMKRTLSDGGAAKRQASDSRNTRKDAGFRKNAKIALSDGEFGKY